MRRKRLQSVANTLCHMFCGWRLANSYGDLEVLGSGTLEINVLSEACSFRGNALPRPLSIAGELNAWLHKELEAMSLPPDTLRAAVLRVELAFSSVPAKQRGTNSQHFESATGRHLAPALFVRCRFKCHSLVVTDETRYESRYEDVDEWPPGWVPPDALSDGANKSGPGDAT